jgi:hypothetical protein
MLARVATYYLFGRIFVESENVTLVVVSLVKSLGSVTTASIRIPVRV